MRKEHILATGHGRKKGIQQVVDGEKRNTRESWKAWGEGMAEGVDRPAEEWGHIGQVSDYYALLLLQSNPQGLPTCWSQVHSPARA